MGTWQWDIHRWMTRLGFSVIKYKKWVYVDGHERADVVQYREEYIDRMEDFDRRNLVRVYHDECIFHSNDDQQVFWCDGSFNPVKSKSEGRVIMVSDFRRRVVTASQRHSTLVLWTFCSIYAQIRKNSKSSWRRLHSAGNNSQKRPRLVPFKCV